MVHYNGKYLNIYTHIWSVTLWCIVNNSYDVWFRHGLHHYSLRKKQRTFLAFNVSFPCRNTALITFKFNWLKTDNHPVDSLWTSSASILLYLSVIGQHHSTS